jgi:hypothetical protein
MRASTFARGHAKTRPGQFREDIAGQAQALQLRLAAADAL